MHQFASGTAPPTKQRPPQTVQNTNMSSNQLTLTSPTSQMTAGATPHQGKLNYAPNMSGYRHSQDQLLTGQGAFRTMQNRSPTSTAYTSKSNTRGKKSNKLSHNYGGQFQMFNASGHMVQSAATTHPQPRKRASSKSTRVGLQNKFKNSNSYVII